MRKMKSIITHKIVPRTFVLLLTYILLLSITALANEGDDIKETEELAKKGDLVSQLKLSMYYIASEDYEKMFYWNKKMAEQNPEDAEFLDVDGKCVVVGAQYTVGLCYENGKGVLKDIKKAAFWYHKAANQGHKEAEKRYLLICLIKLAEQGEVTAQYDLGLVYSESKKYDKAIYWYGKAAEQGDVLAQHNLACLYLDTKNFDKALYWFRHAAKQGYAKSQNNLALCYITGCGVTKDTKKAVYWFQKASDAGHENAKKALTQLQK